MFFENDEPLQKKPHRFLKRVRFGDSITLIKKMKVVLEVDNDDIKKISTNNDIVQDFNNRQTLEWQWTIKPLIKKRKNNYYFQVLWH